MFLRQRLGIRSLMLAAVHTCCARHVELHELSMIRPFKHAGLRRF